MIHVVKIALLLLHVTLRRKIDLDKITPHLLLHIRLRKKIDLALTARQRRTDGLGALIMVLNALSDEEHC